MLRVSISLDESGKHPVYSTCCESYRTGEKFQSSHRFDEYRKLHDLLDANATKIIRREFPDSVKGATFGLKRSHQELQKRRIALEEV